MGRDVLLIEPDYKNKYPPLGLMKIASYYKLMGDSVTFFKGDLRRFHPEHDFDVVAVTSLFTFEWRRTIDTIQAAKKFCKRGGQFLVGGIAATILPEQVESATGVRPLTGLLDRPSMLDAGSDIVIDALPPDYSILAQTDYQYPESDAYLAYTTRGCPNACAFCAVKTLEPEYKDYINIREQIAYTDAHFGKRSKLLLLDNNVFASKNFDRIIDDIKACGFAKGATYIGKSGRRRARYVDFNQGLDARLADDHKMARLAELNIRPVRIAFDHWEQHDIYERAVRLAAKHGLNDLSNYTLYNFQDKPEDLYLRLKLNMTLSNELGINIYSFPMKYLPIADPDFFMNRHYIGPHWNKKFIRAVQSILCATLGKVGGGGQFFEVAWGKDISEFQNLLWMPEAFILHRSKYRDGAAREWLMRFRSLSAIQLERAKAIIAKNDFSNCFCDDAEINSLLAFYGRESTSIAQLKLF